MNLFKNFQYGLISFGMFIGLQAMESSQLEGIRKRSVSLQAQASHIQESATCTFPKWEGLPVEIWALIADQLPGNNLFLNEIARKMNILPATYENIVKALLSYYLDVLQDFPAAYEIQELMERHFKVTRSAYIRDSYKKALNSVWSTYFLSKYEPNMGHIFRLMGIFDKTFEVIAHAAPEPDQQARYDVARKRHIIAYRYAIKLIDRLIASSLINQYFKLRAKVDRNLWKGFGDKNLKHFLIKRLIESELGGLGLTCLPLLGDFFTFESFGQLYSGIVVGGVLFAGYLGYSFVNAIVKCFEEISDFPEFYEMEIESSELRSINELFTCFKSLQGGYFYRILAWKKHFEDNLSILEAL